MIVANDTVVVYTGTSGDPRTSFAAAYPQRRLATMQGGVSSCREHFIPSRVQCVASFGGSMTSHENGPPLDGWQVQPGKHCGTICVDLACPTCGEWVNVPANIELGSE